MNWKANLVMRADVGPFAQANVQEKSGDFVCQIYGGRPDSVRDADAADSIARLIAAAPDMLAALVALAATARTFRNVPKAEQEWGPLDDEALNAAFVAIDKARGAP